MELALGIIIGLILSALTELKSIKKLINKTETAVKKTEDFFIKERAEILPIGDADMDAREEIFEQNRSKGIDTLLKDVE